MLHCHQTYLCQKMPANNFCSFLGPDLQHAVEMGSQYPRVLWALYGIVGANPRFHQNSSGIAGCDSHKINLLQL